MKLKNTAVLSPS